jgi:Flp pilus assembly protein CpaB
MRVRRTAYLLVFALASLVAAGAYWLAQPRTPVVRATADIPALTQVTADMVEVVHVSPLDAAPDTARSLDAVVGRYAAIPVLSGQDLDARALEAVPGSQAFGFGAPVGPGEVAFALPVAAEQAVGGALAPGARVDVIAVPNDAKTGMPAASGAPGTVSLGQDLVILALRSTEGRQLAAADTPSTGALPPRLGSVVVAIPAARLSDFATAALTSTFYLGLDPGAPAASAVP